MPVILLPRRLVRPFLPIVATTFATLLMVGCGSSAGVASNGAAAGTNGGTSADSGTALADTPSPATASGTPMASPPSGKSRAGTVYNIQLVGEGTGDTVGITVFEPTTLVGGQRYPLVLQNHGFGGSRQMSTAASSGPTLLLADPSVNQLLAAGYGAVSISERGSDDSTGTIRVMDPDFEGKDLVSVLDWAEHNLDWLAYGPSADGADAHNLRVGAIGSSYGGMAQFLVHNIDPKRRLDAIVPEADPNDLDYALFPNGVVKTAWDVILTGAGDTAGPTLDRGHEDPYIVNAITAGLSTNAIPQDVADFFYYHSNQYFCGTRTVAGNGQVGAGVGSAGKTIYPEHAPVRGSRINALLFQGMRDTLFTFNNEYANYQCLRDQGGDVRLLTFQAGHNSLKVVPDPGAVLYQPSNNDLDTNCGNVNDATATVAFFDEYVKGVAGAANKVIPTKNCLSLTKGDAVLVDGITTGTNGTVVNIPSTAVVAGSNLDAPIAIPLNITAPTGGTVLGGMPYLQIDIEPVSAAQPGTPVLFFGLGQTRNGVPGVYDLVDNQVTPVRGTGVHTLDMTGVTQRLAAGDTLALLVYGLHDQYYSSGSVNAASPAVVPVTVAGKVWVPMLGNLPNIVQ